MQFLKILFWVISVVVLLIFAHANWLPVSISLWSGMVLVTKLPLLILVSILIGFLPAYILLRTERWRTTRRLATMERNMTGLTSAMPGAETGASATPLEP
jgi:uncharacterized integral membrane protein